MPFPRVTTAPDCSGDRLAYLYCGFCGTWKHFIATQENPDALNFMARCPKCRSVRFVVQREGN